MAEEGRLCFLSRPCASVPGFPPALPSALQPFLPDLHLRPGSYHLLPDASLRPLPYPRKICPSPTLQSSSLRSPIP